ncbi:MAG: hypothetical protein CM1200mP41_07300 [Gammaproteobacteria bacterium]|nr:MAG: hypothetical protein CM1200mP41_07300 [Gammaproteobacteria bacterium]
MTHWLNTPLTMQIGVPKETKNHEYRVGLSPKAFVKSFHGHQIVVERQAGEGFGASDADYRRQALRSRRCCWTF